MSASDDTNFAGLLALYASYYPQSTLPKTYQANPAVSGSNVQIQRAFSLIAAIDVLNMSISDEGTYRVYRNYFTGAYPQYDQSKSTKSVFPRNKYERLLESLRVAEKDNPISIVPYYKPRVWATSTYYAGGAFVLSSDGVNVFAQCYSFGGVGGTSASSGSGPTGKTMPIVTDGTCKWQWIGTVRGSAAFDSTVVTFDSAATVAGYYPHVKTISLDVTSALNGALPLKLLGGTPFSYMAGVGVQGGNYGSAASPAYGVSSTAGWRFGTRANKVSLGVAWPGYAIGQDNISRFLIVVNGRLLNDGPYFTGTPSQYISIDLSKFGADGEEKIVTIFTSTGFTDIKLDSQYEIYDVSSASDQSFGVEGDSTSGGGNTGGNLQGIWALRCGLRLGIYNVFLNAVGGTRFGTPNTGAGTTSFIERSQDLINFGASINFVSSHNDVDAVTQAIRYPKFIEYFVNWNKQVPENYLIVGGSFPLQDELTTESQPGGKFYGMEIDMQAACAFVAAPNVIFSPNVLNVQGAMFTGTGSAESQAYNGNSDQFFGFDKDGNPDSHTNIRGNLFAANYIAAKIRKALKAV